MKTAGSATVSAVDTGNAAIVGSVTVTVTTSSDGEAWLAEWEAEALAAANSHPSVWR